METSPDMKQLVRASVQGIVYLIDSAKGLAYTYNPDRPVFVGHLEKIPEEDKNTISKTNGCMATARIRYRKDIRDVMKAEAMPSPTSSKADIQAPVRINKMEVQLVNTDFSIGAKIRRDALHKVLTETYHLTVSYEPAIYQGVKTKFFYNAEKPEGCPPGLCPCEKLCKGTGDGKRLGACKKITISPFQTGQIIITGARTIDQINEAYRFMCGLIERHADEILRKTYICPTSLRIVQDAEEPTSQTKKSSGSRNSNGWINHPAPRNTFQVPVASLVGTPVPESEQTCV